MRRTGAEALADGFGVMLNNPAVATVLIGAGSPEQIAENAKFTENACFSAEEIAVTVEACYKMNPYMVGKIFLSFLKIGAFTFGGGYAMIPLIQKEVVEKEKWITDEEILEIIAIAESTPGPIAVNAATFIGYKTAGFSGAFFATLGVILPSFLIIAAVSYVLRQFESIKAVQYAFQGIRAGVLALIVKALVSMYKQCPRNRFSYAIAIIAFLSVAVFQKNVLIVIILCAIIGLAYSIMAERRKKN